MRMTLWQTYRMKRVLFILLVSGVLSVFLINIEIFAAGEGNHGHKKSANIGTPGKEFEVTRIVKVSMFDHYFQPQSLQFKEGETAEIVWTFPAHAALEFACNVPGHYDSGMVGKIKLTH